MKKTLKIILMIGFIWIAMSAFSFANAATATISSNKTSATVGDTVKVTVTINAAAWNINVSGSASDSIVGYNGDGENQKTTKTYSIDTSKAGTYKVSITGDVTDASEELKNISNSVSVTVKEKTTSTTETTKKETTTSNTTKSSNAYLSTLGVTPKEYDFSGFTKTKTEYEVTIPNDVDSLKVAYKTADSKASVKVTGNSNLEVGTNKIEVVVTAEDGKTTKTYTINVTKLATEDEKPGNVIEDIDGEIYLTALSIDGLELSPEFAKDVYSYTATMQGLEKNKVEVKAAANNEKANIEISGNDKLAIGENIINIVLTLDGSYEQKVYQITLNVEENEITTVDDQENSQDSGIISNLMNNIKLYAIIAVAVFVFIIVLIIVLICLIKKEKKNENEGDYEDDVKEYNVYENDSSEFEETVQGQSVEYNSNEFEKNNTIEKSKKREKGKHSK